MSVAVDERFPRTENEKTEARMLQLLQTRYSETAGNGAAWAFVPHVRDAAGFGASRTADAIVMALWPSRGLSLHGFEVKVSRSDWLRELKKPEKAEVFCGLVDYWWVVAGDKTIVKDGELPVTWGLLVAQKTRLVVAKEAPALHEDGRPPIDRSFLACLLRSAAKVQAAGPVEIQEALEAERERLRAWHADQLAAERERYEKLLEQVQSFRKTSGVALTSWNGDRKAEDVGRALRLILDGEQIAERLEQRLAYVHRQALEIAESAASNQERGPGA